ncbi:Tenascin-R [Lamellibrachia satsuma]|nr:Tenascin-R [Lamellibrachia satsuma]
MVAGVNGLRGQLALSRVVLEDKREPAAATLQHPWEEARIVLEIPQNHGVVTVIHVHAHPHFLNTSFQTSSASSTTPKSPAYDCKDVLNQGYMKSGVYRINQHGRTDRLQVYCDMETDGGGWLVFQRRQDGSVSFERNWNSFKVGFGDISGEFWLGNDNLYYFTSKKTYSLRIDMEDFHNDKRYADYASFTVASEANNYILRLGPYSGTAGDMLTRHHNGASFTTLDRDNEHSGDNCAVTHKGGWWYNQCFSANLNGGKNRIHRSQQHFANSYTGQRLSKQRKETGRTEMGRKTVRTKETEGKETGGMKTRGKETGRREMGRRLQERRQQERNIARRREGNVTC